MLETTEQFKRRMLHQRKLDERCRLQHCLAFDRDPVSRGRTIVSIAKLNSSIDRSALIVRH